MITYMVSDIVYVSKNFRLTYITFPIYPEMHVNNPTIEDNLDASKYIVFKAINQLIIYSFKYKWCRVYNLGEHIKEYIIYKDTCVVNLNKTVVVILLCHNMYKTMAETTTLVKIADEVLKLINTFSIHLDGTVITESSFTLGLCDETTRKNTICYNVANTVTCVSDKNIFYLVEGKSDDTTIKSYMLDNHIESVFNFGLHSFLIITNPKLYIINLKDKSTMEFNNLQEFIIYVDHLYEIVDRSFLLN